MEWKENAQRMGERTTGWKEKATDEREREYEGRTLMKEIIVLKKFKLIILFT